MVIVDGGLAEAESRAGRVRQWALGEYTLDAGTRVGDLNDRLAEEGFGPPTKPRAADVLARLKERAGAPR